MKIHSGLIGTCCDGNYPLLYVLKMSLHRGVGGTKKPKQPLRNIKIVPNYSV